MKFVCKNLNKIQTNLITHGDPFDCNGKEIIICITGNPGFIDFYTEFSEELHKSTGLPVCVIGHAGHEEVPKHQSKLEGQEHLFNLKGQLKHKLDLLENHVNNNSRLHFIGHSIGAWFVIELLFNNDHLLKKTSSINLLFPTIQNMAKSKKGILLNIFLRKIHTLMMYLISLFCFVPDILMSLITDVYLKLNGLPAIYKERFLKFLNPIIWEKVLHLAYDEMDCVTTLNSKAMEKIKHLTNIIYTKNDGWVPSSAMKDLMVYQPDLKLKEVSADHAFVLKSSESIAQLSSDFIKYKMNNEITNNL